MVNAHRENKIAHAIARLEQRRGIRLDRAAYDRVVDKVRGARGITLKSGSIACPVKIRGKRVIAVWCTTHDCVVTFYPEASWLFGTTATPIGVPH